jgi:L-lactate dehydrogenase complex protein LldE
MKQLTLFVPCMMNHYLPETGKHLVFILEKLGYKIHIVEKEICCGYPFFQDGEKDDAKELAQQFLFDFQTGKRDHKTLIPSSKCDFMVQKCYPGIFHNTVSHNLCQKVVSDITGIYDVLFRHQLQISPPHKSLLVIDCLAHLDIIKSLTNYDAKDSRWVVKNYGLQCCGAGAGLPKNNPNESEKQLDHLLQFASEQGCESLVFTDDICMIFVKNGLLKRQISFPVYHLIDVAHQFFRNA